MNEYLIRAKSFRTKKRLGQNFLISKETIDKIISYVEKDDLILEIGAGIGFVTEKLIEKAQRVVAVELDDEAVNYLEKRFHLAGNFTLIHDDILKTDIPSLFNENERIKVIANIPYYITTPILLHLLGEIDDILNKTRNMVDEIILMVQYEVGKRIIATKNSKNKEYGLLSILSNFWADTEIIAKVPKKMFYPSPKVDSCLVRFKLNSMPRVEITPNLKQTIRAAFSMRRKNIKNCLKASGFVNVDEALSLASIDFNLRGENLSVEEFYNLSLRLKK